jgi:hypothetical protein
MANKYDLKTWAKIGLVATVTGPANGTNIGSGVVAAGKQRFLTYIRVTRDVDAGAAIGSMMIGIGEVTTSTPDPASVLAATYLKLPINFPAATVNAVYEPSVLQEIQGSIEHPILSVGAGKFMGIAASLTNGELADAFATYYDE